MGVVPAASGRAGGTPRQGRGRGEALVAKADVVFVLRTSLGAILLFAAATKLAGFRGFRDGLTGYGLLPRSLVPAGAVVLVAAETVVGLALVARVAPRSASAAAAALFAISGVTLARAVALLGLALAVAGIGGGEGFPSSGRLLADLTLVGGIFALTQLTSVLPEAWAAFRESAPELAPTSVHRVSYRHRPLTLAPERVSDLHWAGAGENGRRQEEVG